MIVLLFIWQKKLDNPETMLLDITPGKSNMELKKQRTFSIHNTSLPRAPGNPPRLLDSVPKSGKVKETMNIGPNCCLSLENLLQKMMEININMAPNTCWNQNAKTFHVCLAAALVLFSHLLIICKSDQRKKRHTKMQ